jgi:hypothetical protein
LGKNDAAQQVSCTPEMVELTIKTVARAASAIEELVTYGQNISDVSESGIAHYRNAAASAIARSENLEKECLSLQQRLSALTAASTAQILDLQSQLKALNEELEKMRSLIWPNRNL